MNKFFKFFFANFLTFSFVIFYKVAHANVDHGHFMKNESCLQEIGSQVFIEGASFIMGDNNTYYEEGADKLRQKVDKSFDKFQDYSYT